MDPAVRGLTVRALAVNAGSSSLKLRLTDLAPLHQPKSLAALDAITALLPGVPAVACFDTAFHADMPPAASTYAIPREWQERQGIRRLVFTGGVGENSAGVRRRAVERLGFLGAALDPDRNHTARGDTDITAAGSAIWTLVITAREDLQIAQEARVLCAVPLSDWRSR